MYFKIHYPTQEDMIYASVRLRKDQWKSLEKYLRKHGDPGDDKGILVFPYGARLVRRGRGWYRIVNYRTIRGIDKITAALKVLKAWYSKYDQDRLLLLSQFLRPVTPAVSPSKLQALLNLHGKKYVNGPVNTSRRSTDTLRQLSDVAGQRVGHGSPQLRPREGQLAHGTQG